MKTRSLRNSGATICGQKESVIEEVKDRKTSTSTGQVAEGMILYDKLFGEPAASKLISLVNDLRAAGKQGQFQDRRIEAIPGLLQDVIDRLLSMQVIPSKPDSCIIDVFNEVPPCVAKKIIRSCQMCNHFTPEAAYAYYFDKISAEESSSGQCPAHSFTQGTSAQLRPPPPSRSPNHIRPKHYAPFPATTMLPASPIHHPLSPPNAVLPLLVPAAVVTAMPYPTAVPLAPGSAGWAVATAPRHQQPPRLLAPGSGVFLPPPGSSNSSTPQLLPATSTEVGSSVETASHSKMENGSINPSVKGRLDGKMEKPDCSGNMDGTGCGREMAKEEHPHSTPAGTA